MKTDLPLKRLTQLCPSDLLPLFGETQATVLRVETLELPSGKSSLDCVLHLQTPDGRPYLHVIEWQGWTDPVLLWRGISYLGWLGQHRRERPILITIVYLKPSDDVGDTLDQVVDGHSGWMVRLPCVRLWEQDAQQAVASGSPGLLALSPLMRGATEALVEDAAHQLVRSTELPLQAELLTVMGVFAEPLLSPERLFRIMTKERLMQSELFRLVYKEQLTDMDQERAAMDQERQLWRATMQDMIEATLIMRFPTAPILILKNLRQIRDTQALHHLHQTILAAPDLATIEQAMAQAVQAS